MTNLITNVAIQAAQATNSISAQEVLEKSSLQLYYWVTILGGTSAAIAFLWKLSKKLIKIINEKYTYLETSLGKINEISKEFAPNHGSSLKDILSKMQTELALNTELTQKIASRQRWMFDEKEMPIFESDEQGLCVWANISYLKLIKRDMNFILGHGWKNVIAQEDRERVVHNWESCVKDGRDSEDTYHIIDSSGKKIKVFTAACKTGRFGYVGAVKILSKEN